MSTATTPTPDPAAPRAADPTIGRLVADATENLSGIIRNEIALAKAEITVDATTAGKGIAMFVVAGVAALFGLLFLLHTCALGLHALGLALWLSYLIVTVVLFVVAGIVAMIGKSTMGKVKGKPERTIGSVNESVDALKRSTSGEATERARIADRTTHGPSEVSNRVTPQMATSGTGGLAGSGSGSTEVTSR